MDEDKKTSAMPDIRNYSIDVMRFFYSWIIVFFHYYAVFATGNVKHFAGGNVAVEFYLIVAACFFYKSFEREEQKSGLGG